jgi:hypothetical protein
VWGTTAAASAKRGFTRSAPSPKNDDAAARICAGPSGGASHGSGD